MRSHLEAILLVLSYEELRLVPYRDAVGKWTYGWGHLLLPGEPRRTLTREEANSLFIADFMVRENGALNSLGAAALRLSPLRIGAVASLTYNIGVSAFSRSTVARLIRSGELSGVPDAFRMWVKGTTPDGRRVTLAGLVDRREAEIRLWSREEPR